MAIIWVKPDNTVAVTTVLDGAREADHARMLQDRGDVPADWVVAAVDYTGGFPAAAQEAWRWDGGALICVTPPAPIVDEISRRQCAAQLFAESIITGPEAIAMTATGTPPAVVEAVLAAIPEPDQTFARLEFAASTYDRTNALVGAVMTALGKDAEARDAFFQAAAVR